MITTTACTCSDRQLEQVGCDCDASDHEVSVSCWPTGVAMGRPDTFKCLSQKAQYEAFRRHGSDVKIFSIVDMTPYKNEKLSDEYCRSMSAADNS